MEIGREPSPAAAASSLTPATAARKLVSPKVSLRLLSTFACSRHRVRKTLFVTRITISIQLFRSVVPHCIYTVILPGGQVTAAILEMACG